MCRLFVESAIISRGGRPQAGGSGQNPISRALVLELTLRAVLERFPDASRPSFEPSSLSHKSGRMTGAAKAGASSEASREGRGQYETPVRKVDEGLASGRGRGRARRPAGTGRREGRRSV